MSRYLIAFLLFSGCAASTRVVFDDALDTVQDGLFGTGTASADDEDAITVISVSRYWTRGTEEGTYYQEDCAESVNGTTTLDYTACCPEGWEMLGLRFDMAPMCVLHGRSATVIEVAHGYTWTGDAGVFTPGSCTTADTGTLIDLTACCPEGWDVLAMGFGRGIEADPSPLCILN